MFWTSAVLSFVVLFPGGREAAAPQGPPRFELTVRQDRAFGSTPGTLLIDENGVEFRSTAGKASRRWDYLALKQVRILSPTRITLGTYEDQGRIRLGADRSYSFEVTGAIPADLVGFLLARLERPFVTAVMPPLPPTTLFSVPVKHARTGRGSDGTLTLYDTGIAYVTEREGQARFWRFRDVYGVLALDRYRLQVLAYEGGSGETRPFTFELKTDLPPGMYDALWQRVNPPTSTNRYR
jgi:hypothetical protein